MSKVFLLNSESSQSYTSKSKRRVISDLTNPEHVSSMPICYESATITIDNFRLIYDQNFLYFVISLPFWPWDAKAGPVLSPRRLQLGFACLLLHFYKIKLRKITKNFLNTLFFLTFQTIQKHNTS